MNMIHVEAWIKLNSVFLVKVVFVKISVVDLATVVVTVVKVVEWQLTANTPWATSSGEEQQVCLPTALPNKLQIFNEDNDDSMLWTAEVCNKVEHGTEELNMYALIFMHALFSCESVMFSMNAESPPSIKTSI